MIWVVSMQVLEQLNLEPEAAMLTDALLKQGAAVHTIVPGGHKIGTPQVQTLLWPLCAWRWGSSDAMDRLCSPMQQCQILCMTGG